METQGQEALRSVASIPLEGLSQDPPIRQPPTWGTVPVSLLFWAAACWRYAEDPPVWLVLSVVP